MLIQWCSVQIYIESKCWNAYSEFLYMYFIKGLRFLIHHYIRYQWQDFSIDLLPFSCYPGLPIFSYWFRAVIRVFMHYPNVANIFVSNHFTLINVLRLRILHCYIPQPHFLLSVVNGSTLVQNHNLPMFHTFRYSNEVCDLKRHLFKIRCLYDSSFHENWCLVTFTLLAMV